MLHAVLPNLKMTIMWKPQYHLLLLYLFLCPVLLNAQLEGDYTVGGESPDFADIGHAVSTLQYQGITGPVRFLVRPGNYSGFTVFTYMNATDQDTVTIQAENEIASSVIIEGRITLNGTTRLKLHKLTLTDQDNSTYAKLSLINTNHCLISHCEITNPSGVNYGTDEAMVKISAPWEGALLKLTFSHCLIHSPEKTIHHSGRKSNLYFNNCSIYGQLSTLTISYIKIILNQCNLTFTQDNLLDVITAMNDCVVSTVNVPYALLIDGQLTGNTFNCNIDCDSWLIHNNTFNENFVSSQVTIPVRIFGNTFEKEFQTIFTHSAHLAGNSFFGPCRINADNYRIWNNFFYSSVLFTHGGGHWIAHNNFHRNSTLDLLYADATIYNNNLGKLYMLYPSYDQLYNNNFVCGNPDSVSFPGKNPSFYDPAYTNESNDLHATNPALIRKASRLFPLYSIDIDSTARRDIPSIGANEICLDLITDTVRIKCADSLCLDLCMEDFGGYYWTPSDLFPSGDSRPVVYPAGDVMVYLNHTDTGIVDSLYIAMTDSLPSARLTFAVNQFEVQFTNRSGCASQFLWEFGDGITSADENPFHIYPHSGLFHGSLTAWNEVGSDNRDFTVNIVIQSAGEPLPGKIRLYPNPAKDHLYIDAEENLLPINLEIINSYGAVFRSEILTLKETCLSLSGLIAGVYVARMSSAGNQYNYRFLIIK